TTVKVPDLIIFQLVKQGYAVWIIAIHGNDGSADRFAVFIFLRRAISAGKQRPFDGEGLEVVVFNEGFDFRVHKYRLPSLRGARSNLCLELEIASCGRAPPSQ